MGRGLIRAALVIAALAGAVGIGILVYHAGAADRARDVPADPTVFAAFEEAGRRWRSHMDMPVRRLVLTSAEQYAGENYLFVFDAYAWFGIGSGFMTSGPEKTRCSGSGGLIRDGGFAGIGEFVEPSNLTDQRSECTAAYGPGRVVAPLR